MRDTRKLAGVVVALGIGAGLSVAIGVILRGSEGPASNMPERDSPSGASAVSTAPPESEPTSLRLEPPPNRRASDGATVLPPVVRAAPLPIRPQHGDGLLPIASKCLRDPFYNPGGVSFSQQQMVDLQALVDQLNGELSRLATERSDEFQAEVDRRFSQGDWVPSDQQPRQESGRRVIYQADRIGFGDQAHPPRSVTILEGDNPRIDELSALAHTMAEANQDTLRRTIAEMAGGR